jgi:hypothetical protein
MSRVTPELPSSPPSEKHHHLKTIRRCGEAITHFFTDPLSEERLERRELLRQMMNQVDLDMAGNPPDQLSTYTIDLQHKNGSNTFIVE